MATSTSSRTSQRIGVVFDGDDTLWMTEELYDIARSSARSIVQGSGLDGQCWEALEREIDVRNVKTYGFSPVRFPTSCVQAYEQVCEREGMKPDTAVAERVRDAAREVFSRNPSVVSCARETLTLLRARGVRLALLTKGERQVQERRIQTSGLADLFDVVSIVSAKDPSTIATIATALKVEVCNAWMVGNSMRSDILPALEAGLRAAWIRAHVWEYERSHDHVVDGRVVSLNSLDELIGIIDSMSAARSTGAPYSEMGDEERHSH